MRLTLQNNPLRAVLLLLLLTSFVTIGRADELNFMEMGIDLSRDHENILPEDQKGKISWDAASLTMTFKDVSIETEAPILDFYVPNLTIRLEGTNSIYSKVYTAAISARSSFTISGSGSLYIKADNGDGILLKSNAALTINDGARVHVVGYNGGVIGDFLSEKLTVDNAYLTATTTNDDMYGTSIGNFGKILLRGCVICGPDKAEVVDIYNGVHCVSIDNNNAYAGEIRIAPAKANYKVALGSKRDQGSLAIVEKDINLNQIPVGKMITFAVTPKEGCHLVSLMAGEEDITASRCLMVTKDVTVTATFTSGAEKFYKVTFGKTEHGTLSVVESVDLNKVPEGSVIHVKAMPEEGYELESMKAGTEDITESRWFTVKSDVTVTASFAKIPLPKYAMRIVVLGAGKVTTQEGFDTGDEIEDGTELNFICTPDAGAKLTSLVVNDEDITDIRRYTVDGENISVQATFSGGGDTPAPQLDPTKRKKTDLAAMTHFSRANDAQQFRVKSVTGVYGNDEIYTYGSHNEITRVDLYLQDPKVQMGYREYEYDDKSLCKEIKHYAIRAENEGFVLDQREVYTYDDKGRLAHYARWTNHNADPKDLELTEDEKMEILYDATGRLSGSKVQLLAPQTFKFYDGFVIKLEYNDRGQLYKRTSSYPDGAIYEEEEYTFDQSGHYIKSLSYTSYSSGGAVEPKPIVWEYSVNAAGNVSVLGRPAFIFEYKFLSDQSASETFYPMPDIRALCLYGLRDYTFHSQPLLYNPSGNALERSITSGAHFEYERNYPTSVECPYAPSQGRLQVSTSATAWHVTTGEELQPILLYTHEGILVRSSRAVDGVAVIDFTSLPAGAYLIVQGQETVKVMR